MKIITKFLGVAVFFGIAFMACQKADVAPYADPALAVPHIATTYTTSTSDTNGSFQASVNSSSVISFTPVKTLRSGYVFLQGVSTYYTITFTLPGTLGPGHYFMGTNNIRATVYNGTTTFVNDANVSDAGSIDITSINSGKYVATFQFFADDSVNTFNSISVSQGAITNM